ncbi:MAG: EAL domain-containing protein [Candidatus Sedimenticola sp. 20ELBAFRAG]
MSKTLLSKASVEARTVTSCHRILLAEDSDVNRDMLSRYLQRRGFNLVTVADGKQALEKIEKERFDLVLLDIMMPYVDGIEVLRRIRQTHQPTALPVIMVTAKTEVEQIGEALDLGANDYIVKPFELKILLARVNTQIQIKKSVQHRLNQSEQISADATKRLEAIYNSASESIITITDNGIIESFNHAAEVTFGYRAEEVVGEDMMILVPMPARSSHNLYLREKDLSKRTIILGREREVSARRKNGNIFPVEICINEVDVADQRVYSCVIRDITEYKQHEQQIHSLTYVDTLTGLDNRNQYFIRFDEAISDARKNNLKLAVMMLDVDRFKEINENFNHSVGDMILHELGNRLRSCVRNDDVVARLGDDEFSVLCKMRNSDLPTIETLLRKIILTIEQPFVINNYKHYIEISIGICYYPDDDNEIEELRRKADMALYKAKEQSQSCYRFYESHMDAEAWNRKKMVDALRKAVQKGDQFMLYYQPQLDLKTGGCTSVEALIRWSSPEYGLVSPGIFIPLAEESGLIISIGDWVLNEGLRQASEWAMRGLDIRVALNVSAIQFAKKDFVDNVRKALQRSNVPPHLIELEITEGMVMDDIASVSEKLEDIRSLGVTLVIDDFGTGYSSLAYLKRLPVHALKIDRAFLTAFPGNSDDEAIIKAITSLADALGLQVIAEGVDRQEQVEHLKRLHCDGIQGFLYSKPLNSDQLEIWLNELRIKRGDIDERRLHSNCKPEKFSRN